MIRKTLALSTFVAFLLPWLSSSSPFAQGQVEAPPPPEASKSTSGETGDFETLMRGPLHEAFATPVNHNPQEGIVVPEKPPEPIDEVPPEAKPEGDVIWIPGYWAWDDQKKDFLWVSGVWRVPPPNRRWVPGYWMEVESGYQWIAGFWAQADQSQVQYQPYPPDSHESGPSSPAPSDEYFWVSGCWVYQNNDYAWRPGYWTRGYANWVWVPSHYVWTPRGCIYVDGYWDHRWKDRGMCFAPVYFRGRAYAHARFSYRPTVALDVSRLLIHLFVRPNYCHYYYGDWYGRDRNHGIYASFQFHQHHGYAPVYAHSRWYYKRKGIDYDDRVRGWHDYLTEHEEYRPPHTWDKRDEFVKQNSGFKYAKKMILADNLQQLVADAGRATNLRKIDTVPQRQLRQTVDAVRQAVTARKKVDSQLPGAADATRAAKQLQLPELPGAGILRGASEQAKAATSEVRPTRRPDVGERTNVQPPVDTRRIPPRAVPGELRERIQRPGRDVVPTPRDVPTPRPRIPNVPRVPSTPSLPTPSLPFP